MREGRRIDNRFENRPWLTPRVGSAVELALGVIAPANHGQDLSRMRVERDESYFRPRRVIAPGDDPGQTIEMLGDCLIRRLLKIRVERRFDPQTRPYFF